MQFEKEYDTLYLSSVIEYNHRRYEYFKNNGNLDNFNFNLDYERTLKARYTKVSRIKRRLLYLLCRYDYIWFITFTFDDKRIGLSTHRKRELIRQCLNTHDFKYILNVDYGKTTEREHYHCILGTNWNMDVNQFIKNEYPCFSLSIPCKLGENDFKRLCKYVNKLTNHCIKATTKKQRLVYNFKGYDDICPTSYDRFISYTKDYIKLFGDVVLLDKDHISGQN